MPNKKILVTGGAGYIGSHANALLNTLGFQTIVLDNLVYGHKESLHYAPLPFSYTSPFTKSPTISSQYLDSTLTNHTNKTINSSNCSVALETLAKLEGRSYLSDMTIHRNLANRSNCIDKGEFLQSPDSKTPNTQDSVLDFLTQLEQNFNGGGGGKIHRILFSITILNLT